VNNTC